MASRRATSVCASIAGCLFVLGVGASVMWRIASQVVSEEPSVDQSMDVGPDPVALPSDLLLAIKTPTEFSDAA